MLEAADNTGGFSDSAPLLSCQGWGAQPSPGIPQTTGHHTRIQSWECLWRWDLSCPSTCLPMENGESIYCFALLLCEAFPLSTELLYLNTLPIPLGEAQVKPPHSTHTFSLLSCHSRKKVTLKYATEQHGELSEIVTHHCTKPRIIPKQNEVRSCLTNLPRNFLGGLLRSPASGCTTHRSSTRLQRNEQ